MTLLSFVGTSAYRPVEYALGDRSLRTEFITEALAAFLGPERVQLLVTAGARQHANCASLESRLRDRGFAVELVPIPDGTCQAELWQLFERIGAIVASKSGPVALDLTHAFRSLPAVALLAASHFQALGRMELQGLYYGAFEARDALGRAPVFDLTAMLALPQWALAARAWRDHANADPMRQLLRGSAEQIWKATGTGPRRLGDLASALDAFSSGLALARHDLATQAAGLRRVLLAAAAEVRSFAPPFAPLLEEAAAPLPPLAQPGLEAQWALARFQLAAGYLLAACLLAREWVVSFWMQCHAVSDRGCAELKLGKLADVRSADQPGALWGTLTRLRNDLAHCGHRPEPLNPAQLRRQLDDVFDQIETFSIASRP